MAKRKASKKNSTVDRRTPKRLSHTLYTYVEPINGRFARSYGKKNFGSFSSYVDVLIAADRKQGFSKKWANIDKATPSRNTKPKKIKTTKRKTKTGTKVAKVAKVTQLHPTTTTTSQAA